MLYHMEVLRLVFWGISILFSTVATPIYIPAKSVDRIPFLHILANICCVLFDDSHSDRCEVISHCGFYLHFPDDWRCWTFFLVSVCHLHSMSSLEKCLLGLLSIFLIGFFVFLMLSCMSCLCMLGINSLPVIELYELFMYVGY